MKGALFLALTQPRPFPMDLHHSWGGPFAVEKNLLFRTQSNKKSINLGALPVFDFCHQTYCEKHPYLFPALFCFFPHPTARNVGIF